MDMPQMQLVTHSKNGKKRLTTTDSIAKSFTVEGYQAPSKSAVKRSCSTILYIIIVLQKLLKGTITWMVCWH